MIDKSKMQCFVCQKFDHFAREWNANKKEPQVDEVKVVRQKFDEESTLLVMITWGECNNNRLQGSSNSIFGNAAEPCCNRLQIEEHAMVTTKEEIQCNDEFYLDSICYTQMTWRKYWFVTVNCAMKNKVKFTNDTILADDGIGDVLIMRRNGVLSLIKYVFYIPWIKRNLLSIAKLLEKGYKIHVENKVLRIMAENQVLVLKSHMDTNRTLKVELKVMEHSLDTSASREELIWHYWLRHLNFRDLNVL